MLGVERDEEHSYLISRLVVGARFDRTDLSDEEAIRAVAAVCDALAHAHDRSVVHRDVKPSNILVSDDGDVVLTDFGIARDRDAAEQTMDENVLGTLSYMAPEQARASRRPEDRRLGGRAHPVRGAGGQQPLPDAVAVRPARAAGQGRPSLAHKRPDLPSPLIKAVIARSTRIPRKRPDARGLRDALVASLRPEEDEEPRASTASCRCPGSSRSAAPAPPRWPASAWCGC